MALPHVAVSSPARRSRSIVRTMTVGGLIHRFNEYEVFSNMAAEKGQLLGEWAREVLLREIKENNREFDLVCEVVGLQLLLMNVLAPMARGERITAEQFQGIVKSVQTAKVKAAGEMLSRRHQPKEA
jgi:hypothetical protein